MSEDPLSSHPVSLAILGVINAALAGWGVAIVQNAPRFGAFEVLVITVNLICAVICFRGAYVRWREICSRG